jgi:hypothetical protein
MLPITKCSNCQQVGDDCPQCTSCLICDDCPNDIKNITTVTTIPRSFRLRANEGDNFSLSPCEQADNLEIIYGAPDSSGKLYYTYNVLNLNDYVLGVNRGLTAVGNTFIPLPLQSISSIPCVNQAFGGDPLPNTVKHCWVRNTPKTIKPVANGYTKCADFGQTCHVNGKSTSIAFVPNTPLPDCSELKPEQQLNFSKTGGHILYRTTDKDTPCNINSLGIGDNGSTYTCYTTSIPDDFVSPFIRYTYLGGQESLLGDYKQCGKKTDMSQIHTQCDLQRQRGTSITDCRQQAGSDLENTDLSVFCVSPGSAQIWPQDQLKYTYALAKGGTAYDYSNTIMGQIDNNPNNYLISCFYKPETKEHLDSADQPIHLQTVNAQRSSVPNDLNNISSQTKSTDTPINTTKETTTNKFLGLDIWILIIIGIVILVVVFYLIFSSSKSDQTGGCECNSNSFLNKIWY